MEINILLEGLRTCKPPTKFQDVCLKTFCAVRATLHTIGGFQCCRSYTQAICCAKGVSLWELAFVPLFSGACHLSMLSSFLAFFHAFLSLPFTLGANPGWDGEAAYGGVLGAYHAGHENLSHPWNPSDLGRSQLLRVCAWRSTLPTFTGNCQLCCLRICREIFDESCSIEIFRHNCLQGPAFCHPVVRLPGNVVLVELQKPSSPKDLPSFQKNTLGSGPSSRHTEATCMVCVVCLVKTENFVKRSK